MYHLQNPREILSRSSPVYDDAINFLYATCMDGEDLINSISGYQYIDKSQSVIKPRNDALRHSVMLPRNEQLSRPPSFRKFSALNADGDAKVSDVELFKLLANLKSNDGRMQYPSAGGIYSIKVWVTVFPDRLSTDLREGVYAYNHETNLFEHAIDCSYVSFINCFHPSGEQENEFSFAVFFTLDLQRALSKYKQRGVLFGAMEVGAIYQELNRAAQSQELKSLVFGGYRLHAFCKTLGINQLYQFPLAMQLFGHD
jgi:SagB-type dehydrogenase family enzyme